MKAERDQLPVIALSDVVVSGKNASLIASSSLCIWAPSGRREVSEQGSFFAAPKTAGGGYVDPASRVVVASARALKDAVTDVGPEQLGCILGTRTGNACSVALYETARIAGRRVSPLLFAHAGWNVPVAMLAAELSCRGLTSTICCGAESGAEALRYTNNVLTRGRARTIVVGVVASQRASQSDCSDGAVHAVCMLAVIHANDKGWNHCAQFGATLMEDLPNTSCLPREIHDFANALQSQRTTSQQ